MKRELQVSGRNCAGCTLCCKLLSVEELNMPPLVWCPKCDVKQGCTIYADRPTECRQFFCQYLADPRLGEHWKPSRCKIVVSAEDYAKALVIHTDPARPDTWRREPFYSDILGWAKDVARRQWQVIVWEGERKIVISPHDADVAEAARSRI